MYLKNLKLLRNEKELTQDDISKYLGVSRTTYNNWEQGTVLLPLDIADKLSVYYKVRLSLYSILLSIPKIQDNLTL